MAMNLPQLPETAKISTSIIRILGGNPSKFTLQGSNTYLLGTGHSRILLDTGEGRAAWAESVAKVLKDENCYISECLLSHWHGDHVGGVDDMFKVCKDAGHGKPMLKKHMPSLNPHARFDTSILGEIAPDEEFSTPEGFTVKALHTPGHTRDHMCFLVTASPDETEVGSLFTFDNVLGHGTAVFEDLAAYLSTLRVMRDAVPEEKVVMAYPGHGAVIPHARQKILEYIDHRQMREDEALNVLRYGAPHPPSQPDHQDSITRTGADGREATPPAAGGGKEWTSMDMVKVIYRHYPENLWAPAEGGLLMVLEKLRGDGSVQKSDEGKWSIREAGIP
jgi:endoribonuclease LACTB2